MSYAKGEIYIDTNYWGYDGEGPRPKAIMLPHSCDQWVIGGVEEARNLIADLKEAIEALAESPYEEGDK